LRKDILTSILGQPNREHDIHKYIYQ